MSERGVEPGCTVFTLCEIRVALVAIGEVPSDVWDQYASLVTHHTRVGLPDARSFYQEQQKSPFTYLPWNTGALHLKYLLGAEADASQSLCKRAPLSACHKVLGVIGVCHCTSQEQIDEAYKEFEQKCREYPEARTFRCFASEPPGSQGPPSTANAYLVMFPPDGEKLESLIGVMMNDFAACVLMELEKWMLSASLGTIETTWLDAGEFSVPVSTLQDVQMRLMNDEELARRRKHGRLAKARGDHCLLAGSPRNAAEHFTSAIELARTANDFVWLGAAQEGLMCAKVLMPLVKDSAFAQQGVSTKAADTKGGKPAASSPGLQRTASQNSRMSSSTNFRFGSKRVMEAVRQAAVEPELREVFAEAQAAYRKPRVHFLQIELDLKMGRLLAGLHGNQAKKEVIDLVSGIVEASNSISHINDRLIASMEASELCGLVGAGRKQALLMWRVVELSRGMERQNKKALAIVREALRPVLAKTGSSDMSGPGPSRGGPAECDEPQANGRDPQLPPVRPVQVHSSWPAVHCGVLEALLGSSTRTMAHQEAWRAAATILCHHANRLSEDRQQWLLDTLKVASRYTDNNVLRGPGPPPLINLISLKPPEPWLRPVDVVQKQTGPKKGPFIFSALKSRGTAEKKGMRWVCDEECEVHIEVSNPCALPISVDRMALAGFYQEEIEEAGNRIPYPHPQNYTRWKGTAVTVWLPARTPPSKMMLTGVARKPGRLIITGCYVQMFGVTWHQPWREKGDIRDKMRERLISIEEGATALDPFRALSVEVVPPLQLLRGSLVADRLEWVQSDQKPGADNQETSDKDAAFQKEEEAARKGKPKEMFMVAYEGEVLMWDLQLDNVGVKPITCVNATIEIKEGVAEVNQRGHGSAGAGKRSGMGRPPVSVELDEAALKRVLPLAPEASAQVPITVRIGECGTDTAGRFQVMVKLEYLGDCAKAGEPAVEDTVNRGEAAPNKTQGAPIDTEEDGQGPADGLSAPPGNQAPAAQIGRVLELPVSLTVHKMLRIAGCTFFRGDMLLLQQGGDTSPATASRCHMELQVQNSGDKRYKAWVGAWGSSAAQENVDIPPRGARAVSGMVALDPEVEDEKAMPRLLASSWGLHWQQMPAEGEQPGDLPQGFLPLEKAMAVAAMGPAVCRSLLPPALEVEFSAALLEAEGADLCKLPLRRAADVLRENGAEILCPDSRVITRPHCMLGCTSAIGEMTHLSMRLFNRMPAAMAVKATVECYRLFRPANTDSSVSGKPGTQLVPILRTPPNDLSFMSMGVMQGISIQIPAGGSELHSFGLCFLVPGLYEIFGHFEPLMAGPRAEAPIKGRNVAATKLYVLVLS